jgi:acyl-CoA reductase-like NAD-dependent aldehyde dehydrogenase
MAFGSRSCDSKYISSRQSVNAEISTASPEDIEEAIAKADQAWRAPEWRNRMPHERAKILYKVADIIEARVDEFQNYKPVIMVSHWQKRVV